MLVCMEKKQLWPYLYHTTLGTLVHNAVQRIKLQVA